MSSEDGGGGGGGGSGGLSTAGTHGSSWNAALTDQNLIAAIIDFFTALINTLENLFEGRPQAEATTQAASRLLRAPNPVARVYGMELVRGLHELDVDISQSGPRAEIEHAFFGAFVLNLENQGVTHTRAFEIASHALSREAQAGAPLEPELARPMPADFQLYGPAKFNDEFQRFLLIQQQRFVGQQEAVRLAVQELFRAGSLGWWARSQFTNKPPPGLTLIDLNQQPSGGSTPTLVIPTQPVPGEGPPPPPLTINPITGQPLPDGFGWDRTTQQPLPMDPLGVLTPPQGYQYNPCTAATEPIPSQWQPGDPLGPPPPIPATQNPAQPFDLCCSLIVQSIQYLAAVVATRGAAGVGVDLSRALTSLNETLAEIANTLAQKGGTDTGPAGSADLDRIVELLQRLVPKTREDRDGSRGDWWEQADYSPAELDRLVSIGAMHPDFRAGLQGAVYVKVGDPASVKAAYDKLKSFEKRVDRVFGDVESALKHHLGSFANAFGDTIEKDLKALGKVSPETGREAFGKVMADAFEFGATAHLISLAAETVVPLKHLGVAQLAQFAAEFAGFRELVRAYHGPIIDFAVRRPSLYHAGNNFRSVLPVGDRGAELGARRLIDHDKVKKLLGYAGFSDDYHDAIKEAAYRPAQAFLLLRGVGLVNLDLSPAIDALGFAGYRDQDIEPLVDAAKRQGLQGLRNSVLSELVQSAADGLFSEASITSEMQALDLTPDAQSLLLTHIRYLRLRKLAGDFKKELDVLAQGGVIALPDYAASLSAIGYQKAEIDIFSGTIAARLEGRTLSEAAREEARINRDSMLAGVRTALQEFKHGNIGLPALGGLLIGAGFTPAQAAAHTALAAVEAEPTVKVGTKLSKFAQKQADDKLSQTLVIDQYGRGEIPIAEARRMLAGLGLSQRQIETALQTAYAKSLKKAAVESPYPRSR